MDAEAVRIELEQKFEDADITVKENALSVPAEHIAAVGRVLRDEEPYRLDYLSCVIGTDYPDDGEIEVVYILYSVEKGHGPLILKVRVPREGEACRVPSVTPVWRGAEFQEREIYDLYGVTFDGHPDLRRILLWDGFEGHPMRKDFVAEDQDAVEYPGEQAVAEGEDSPEGNEPAKDAAGSEK